MQLCVFKFYTHLDVSYRLLIPKKRRPCKTTGAECHKSRGWKKSNSVDILHFLFVKIVFIPTWTLIIAPGCSASDLGYASPHPLVYPLSMTAKRNDTIDKTIKQKKTTIDKMTKIEIQLFAHGPRDWTEEDRKSKLCHMCRLDLV